jgi:hypothetical protein
MNFKGRRETRAHRSVSNERLFGTHPSRRTMRLPGDSGGPNPPCADLVVKAGCRRWVCRSVISLGATGFEAPALTPAAQLQRYDMHRTWAGGGRATSDATRRSIRQHGDKH